CARGRYNWKGVLVDFW
nr:immunoglobulin heavy chain junction region [Macaca mulatta]MOX62699.1 immunoglobulin heavy chain junction region [Macaca mulatta]MOX64772.1 immunoglobulin heavy chain junction region [Macaca mulatta]